ncbi:methyl-accepting chemotaxis protein [Haloarcula laminariae]|uniref:methyl-accepting chemotaxis protein n=1 Tax=Haloarcula laminariae TaxID=2961577 RepID=UPI0024061F82|nr:methyl-accepting chemotaxis protein [Halomicroarcula sp. FL173]
MGLTQLRSLLDIRGSYGRKFAGLLLAIMLLTAAVGGVIYTTVGNEIRADTEASLQTNADLEAERLDNWFAVMTRQAETLPRSVAFRSGDEFHATDQLYQLTAREAVSGAYFFNRTDGTTVATAGSESAVTSDGRLQSGLRQRTEQLFSATDDRVVYSEPFRPSATGKPQLLLLSKSPSDETKTLAILIDLERLSEQMLGDGGAANVRVTNQAGTVVLAQDPSALLSTDPVATDRFEGGNGSFTTTAGAQEQSIGYARSEQRGWTVTRRVPTDTAYQLQQTVSTQLLALLAVLLGGLLVVGLTLGRNTVRSVRDLSQRAQTVRDGDLDAPIESGREDEIGELYASFDAMRESLKQRIDELERERKRVETAHAEVIETNTHLRNKADDYSTVMERVADGDLTTRMEPDGENDAMDAIAEDFNVMMAELERTTGQLKQFATHVEESGEVVGTNAANVKQAAEQVAESIQRISDDSYRQREELRDAIGAVDQAVDALKADDIDRAQERLDALAEQLSELAETTDTTLAETETVAGAAEEQAAELTEVSARAEHLIRYVEPLQKILDSFEAEAEHEFVFSGGPSLDQGNTTDD